MNEVYESNVKSNVRRKAKGLDLDLAGIQTIVKAGKKFYRLPLTAAPPPKPAKVTKTKAPAKPKAAKTPKAAKKPKGKTFMVDTSPTAALIAGLKFKQVEEMLRQPGGAAISAVCKATKWLPHTARARISVNVSKLLAKGEVIERRRENGESHYAIVKSKQQDLPL